MPSRCGLRRVGVEELLHEGVRVGLEDFGRQSRRGCCVVEQLTRRLRHGGKPASVHHVRRVPTTARFMNTNRLGGFALTAARAVRGQARAAAVTAEVFRKDRRFIFVPLALSESIEGDAHVGEHRAERDLPGVDRVWRAATVVHKV